MSDNENWADSPWQDEDESDNSDPTDTYFRDETLAVGNGGMHLEEGQTYFVPIEFTNLRRTVDLGGGQSANAVQHNDGDSDEEIIQAAASGGQPYYRRRIVRQTGSGANRRSGQPPSQRRNRPANSAADDDGFNDGFNAGLIDRDNNIPFSPQIHNHMAPAYAGAYQHGYREGYAVGRPPVGPITVRENDGGIDFQTVALVLIATIMFAIFVIGAAYLIL